ncbi:hypothetical protein DSM104443_02229 [Usitatibacter rugosus]|uniref:Uncharacterized protein n=1 Tax=Usitatibacter rugosus TaxID=2732067 RepID=A0A6M4H022_9PROT|nr:hypothetical protein [Usitatibacter rugosus]QJR11157.1 hypothetical protein DSM104443_02229 [Usitatibacter rugosus]
MNTPTFTSLMSVDAQKASIERHLSELRETLKGTFTEAALTGYYGLHADVDGLIGKIKRRLLGSALAWNAEEKEASAWIYYTSRRMAKLGQRLLESIDRKFDTPDGRTLDVAALALLYLGESVKCEVNVGRQDPYDYRGTHAIMSLALATGRQGDERRFAFDGRPVASSIEGLYFRALLLAKFSTGNLNAKQIEIFDACLWLWMPVLRAVRESPSASALRADLDSGDGLRRGPRHLGAELSLYLPPEPIEAAYRSALKEFHAGRIIPSEGFTAEFGIEEHVAVLDVVRQGLLDSRSVLTPRAERRAAGFEAEAFVGLAEIMARGFGDVAQFLSAERSIRWVDVSDTGLGASWRLGDCGEISVGDLVGIRRSAADPLIVGRVVRSVPAAEGGRTEIGVSIVTQAARRVSISRPSGHEVPGAIDVLYVPGTDGSGRHDAYLIPDRLYRDAGPFEALVDGDTYEFRFNRMRERGHGWALAGVEITGVRRATVSVGEL